MFKVNNYKFIMMFVLAIMFFISLPKIVLAANLYFTSGPQNIYQGDIFLINLKISSTDDLINAIEGTLLFNRDKLEIKELSTGGSIFSLWPKYPAFSNEKGEIEFVGGVPGGFQGKNGEVLKIIFIGKNTGKSKLNFNDDISLFLNDGKGSKISAWVKPLDLIILERPEGISPKDEWQTFVAQDKTPPELFEVTIQKNPLIFNGKYFISFFTTDKDSGLSYYEVQEGELLFHKAESPYLLKDQNLQSEIKVKAVDKAGNERIVSLPPTYLPVIFYKKPIFWIIIITVVGLIFYISLFLKKKPRINKR